MTKAKPNLHEINNEINALIFENTDPVTGEISEALAKNIDELEGTREGKILGCATAIRDHEAKAGSLSDRIKDLQVRKKRHDREATFLKWWIETGATRGETFESNDIAVSFRKSTKYQFREGCGADDTLVSMLSFKPAPLPTLDKKACADYAKRNHESPPGVDEIEGLNLQIK